MTQAKKVDDDKQTLPPEMRRAGIVALEKAQAALAGVAARAGLEDEDAVVTLCKENRRIL